MWLVNRGDHMGEFDSDGQQLQQYQQIKQLPLTSTIELKKKTITYDVENSDSGLGQAQNCGGVKLINKIPTLLFFFCKKHQYRIEYNNIITYKTSYNLYSKVQLNLLTIFSNI